MVVAAVCALAAAVAALWIRPPFQWPTLALVVGMVALLDARGEMTFRIGRARMSFSAKAYASIGAVYLLGIPGALAAALGAVLVSVWVKRGISLKSVFNLAMFFLAASAAYGVFELILRLAPRDIFVFVVAGAAGGCATGLVNHLLLGPALAAEHGREHFKVRSFVRTIAPLLPYYPGYGLAGAGVLAASYYIGNPAALVTLAGPVAILQITTNHWIKEEEAHLEEVRSGFNATLVSLSKAIDLRDKGTEGHCRRVVEYCLLIGRNLGLGDAQLTALCHGALLHDIGKIGVPDAVLLKPGPLNEEEWAAVRKHPEAGFAMVADVKQLESAREIILNHHEHYDGSGYPHGLQGDEIPIAARVFGIADSFDAMVSDRPYRRGMDLAVAREEIRRCSGTQFDPACVAAFSRISDEELEVISKQREQPTTELLSQYN